MATADPVDIIRVPGRLVANPTDLSTAFPHGGTPLGVTRDQEFRLAVKYHEEKAQEWGGVTNRVLYCGQRGVFAAVLRSWDTDAWTLVFPETGLGAKSQHAGPAVDVNGSNRSGRFLSGAVLLWSATALDAHPSLLIYNAVPMLDEGAKLQLGLHVEMTAAAMWAATPDSAGRTYDFKPIGDLSL